MKFRLTAACTAPVNVLEKNEKWNTTKTHPRHTVANDINYDIENITTLPIILIELNPPLTFKKYALKKMSSKNLTVIRRDRKLVIYSRNYWTYNMGPKVKKEGPWTAQRKVLLLRLEKKKRN